MAVIELLRCPAGQHESPLVASALRQVDRRILEGDLGCPVCGASYAIRGGVAHFRAAETFAHAEPGGHLPNEDAVMRLAAQLDLTEPARLVLLFGEYARCAPALSLMFDAMCVAVNAPPEAERHIAEHASVLRVTAVIPLARDSMHGAALDLKGAATLGLEQVRGVLRARGRLVAYASTPLPRGVQLLALDESEWVALRTADVIQLGRATR